MSIKQLTAAAAFVSVLLAFGPLQARNIPAPVVDSTLVARLGSPLLGQLPAFDPAPSLAQSVIPDAASVLADSRAVAEQPADAATADEQDAAVAAAAADITDLRKSLIAMAMKLRDTRYVRGGRDPSTGFDCSGFVRYVFAHAIGMRLPANAASQFLAGFKVSRGRLKTGDLVFFHTSGKHRISHVGIYLSDGRFIHAPTSGKTVEVSSLNETYWSRRFAGARRPAAIVAAANNG